MKIFTCEICEKKITRRFNLYLHIKNVHRVEPYIVGKMLCPMKNCNKNFKTFITFRKHLNSIHDLQIIKEELFFPNMAAAMVWKEELERIYKSSYTIDSTKFLKDGRKRTYMRCHRSGYYESVCTRQSPKMGGTCKINATCPSTIDILESENETKVTYHGLHVGHALDLKHFPLRKANKLDSSSRPSLDPEDPDYVPNVFFFKNSKEKRKKNPKKILEKEPESIVNEDCIEEMSVNVELSSSCDTTKLFSSCDTTELSSCDTIEIEELSEIKNKVLKMKTELQQQNTLTSGVEKEDNELSDTDTTQSVFESSEYEDDEFLSLKFELSRAYTDIATLRKEKDIILKELSSTSSKQKTLQISVSEKEKELSKLKKELQQAYNEINALRAEKDSLKKKYTPSDTTDAILQDPSKLNFYTGLNSSKDFQSVLSLIYDVDTTVRCISMETQLLIVLMKVKLNLLYSDLAHRFQTSLKTVRRICENTIPPLQEKLELLIKCPINSALKKNIPICYKNTVFEKLYHRLLRNSKAKTKQSENEDADLESI